MADPLSVAAAGAGFLSLAGQVLDGIVKLRGFIATVNSAPREIHDLCHELDIFRGLLEEAGRRVQESLPMGVDASQLKDTFAHCEKMRGYAESALKRLEVNIHRSKSTTALRFPFKKKEIEGMLLGVERGKTSLLLANQSFESSLVSRRHVALSADHDLLLDHQRKTNEEIVSKTISVADSHNQKFASIAHDIAASAQASRAQTRGLEHAYTEGCRQIRTTLSQLQDQSTSISSSVTGQAQQNQRIATSVFNAEHAINEVNARLEALALPISSQSLIETTTRTTLSFGLMPLSITLEQTTSRKQQTPSKPKRTARLLNVRLPKWFLHRQYDLQLLYATSGWPFMLNARSVVQYDSPFFEACRTGDIETIKYLLSNKQASIYDRTFEGITGLQFAIGSCQLEVCKLLRYAGIFAQFDHNDYRDSLRCLSYCLNDFTGPNLSLLRVIAPLDDPDRDWFREYCQTTTDDGTRVLYADIDLFSLLNSAQSDTAVLNVSHLKAYFECRIHFGRYGYHSFMPYIVRVLSDTSTAREISAASDKFAWVVYALAREIALKHPVKIEIEHPVKNRHSVADEWSHSVCQALRAVVYAGINPHQTSGKLESPFVSDEWYQNLTITPLILLCVEAVRIGMGHGYGTQNECNQDVNAKLQAWLMGLHSAGINLSQYAESESACDGYSPNLLVIPWKTECSITVVTGPRPEDWRVSLWKTCESYARLFWCLVDGEPILHRLTAKLLEAYPVPEHRDPNSRDMPGSWPSTRARVADELESCLLREADQELAQMEEDLPSLSKRDFFAKWYQIDEILGPRSGLRLESSALGIL